MHDAPMRRAPTDANPSAAMVAVTVPRVAIAARVVVVTVARVVATGLVAVVRLAASATRNAMIAVIVVAIAVDAVAPPRAPTTNNAPINVHRRT